MVAPGTLFEELGFNYIGPIDGHDLPTLLTTLKNMRALEGPQFLHIITKKGKGYPSAEEDPCVYHGVTAFDPKTGKMVTKSAKAPTYTQIFSDWLCDMATQDERLIGITAKAPTYTQIFSDWLCDMATQDERLIGITPAMCEGSGLVDFSKLFPKRYFDVGIAEQHSVTFAAGLGEGSGLVDFSELFPKRYFDVGIAEQHSVTFAAGLACDGLKPVVAIYSSFLQLKARRRYLF